MMKFKILALGNEEMTQWVENSLISKNIEVVRLNALPDTLINLKQDNFNLAVVSNKLEDLKNVCFRVVWLCRIPVAILGGKNQEDQDELISLGVSAFISDSSGQAELAADVSALAARRYPQFKSVRVMAIEDDKYIREAIRLCFKIFWPEADVSFSDDGASGIENTLSLSPDIVLLDLGLPDMTGYEVLTRIRAFSQAPIIILSATRDKENIVKAIQSGANDYIIKPFKQIELMPRVKKYTG
jgi:DNA-binding response OmpR family regulator